MSRCAGWGPGGSVPRFARHGRLGRSDDEQRDDARKPVGRSGRTRNRDGLSLAVADVGWFNTENLFREIDRESVAVLLLKCLDYVNGWRRGLYPWSRACRLRRCGTGRRGSSSSSCRAAG